jgi:hypothetical protein
MRFIISDPDIMNLRWNQTLTSDIALPLGWLLYIYLLVIIIYTEFCFSRIYTEKHLFRTYQIEGSICKLGIFSGMEYWFDIIENHDHPKIKGSKSKDHGTFSEKAAAILLIYLANGTDCSTCIEEFFNELLKRVIQEKSCPSALKYQSKISSVLKRMNDEKLVILTKEISVGAGTRKYYDINPQILQSPINGETCIKPDGSILEIPLETIESFLGWLALEQAGIIDKDQQEQLDKQVRQERHERIDDFLLDLLPTGWVDYNSFLEFIKAAASVWDSERGLGNEQHALEDSISCYIHMSPH